MSNNVLFQRGEEDGDSDAWDDTALIKAYDDAVSAMKTKLAAQHPEFSIPNDSQKKKKRNKAKTKKKKSSHKHSKSSHGWKVGDFCQAVFTEDGEVYSAQILSLNYDDDTCLVKYLGYGNEEQQPLDSLLPPSTDISSQDAKTDTASEADSLYEAPEDRHSQRRKGTYVGGKPTKSSAPPWSWNGFTAPPLPPPPPPSAPHHYPAFAHPPSFHPPNLGAPHQLPHMFPGIPPPPPVFNSPGAENENEALYSMLISWYMSGYHTGYYQGLKNAKSTSLFGGPHR